MVMTSEAWHIMFEKARESEYMYVLNEIRKGNEYLQRLNSRHIVNCNHLRKGKAI